jgi:hypothetical protein|nr:MAG TPA: hypothetical protein [Caudoviricetes sp.]DAS93928.1 MAG TPA: hypothetical protein [Caudoviricetes sp.]
MDELEKIEKLVELEIIKRKYEKLLNIVLENIQLQEWNKKTYVDDDGKIISFLELLEQEKFEARKKQLLITEQEKQKEKDE